MFGNVLYCIVALLIYSTYPVSGPPNFSPAETSGLFFATTAAFAGFAWIRFQQLGRRGAGLLPHSLSSALEALQTRLSVMALGLFALDIYGLSLPTYLAKIPIFALLPTLQALVFLGLFLAYAAIVWTLGHDLLHRIGHTSESRSEHIVSNIQLVVPVLLPWLALSGLADLLMALPLPAVHRFLSSAPGEITYFITFLLAISIFGPVMMQKFWRCRPLPPGLDRLRIESLCRRAGVGYADILQWPLFGGRMITAGVMGLVARFRYILVTPALLRILRAEEVEAVIAHEIGHVKRRHLAYYLLFLAGYMLLSLVVLELIPYTIITIPHLYHWIGAIGMPPPSAMSALFSVCVIAVFIVYFRIVFGYFMRNFERQADAYVYTLFHSALPMISTFQKIALTSGQSPERPNWHHFSIAQRIAFLRACEADPQRLRRHDRKVRLSLALYLGVLVLIGAAAWSMNFGDTGRRLSRQAYEHILHREIERHPENGELRTVLGDLYFSQRACERARAAYQEAIGLNPNDARALNNLAWLLATCEDRRMRDPALALKLARRSVALDPAPHALDTLAEAYFANGDFAAAVATEKRVLAKTDEDHEVFQAQMDKFRKALNGR